MGSIQSKKSTDDKHGKVSRKAKETRDELEKKVSGAVDACEKKWGEVKENLSNMGNEISKEAKDNAQNIDKRLSDSAKAADDKKEALGGKLSDMIDNIPNDEKLADNATDRPLNTADTNK